ncbi:hypothetical protein SARC_16322 [Sphaeroforma arctica JP610]|uniref:Uncharacterized protein n=1 Tax=Sphaeroforma arctica JP610 TaxID=667725 RepID=A0A0L0F3G8_9EUKA|nr:hypothetical protein SARC_16322 [Sphaeroforma arctica JP610]KNC71144.1 hypothetical protein SARC_16322 [Sphaeroforma arctica JP610]|eukprot:XP_014145046.1 hypothetical protein SARC_16322 [Sphaeroforma arctica JP610]
MAVSAVAASSTASNRNNPPVKGSGTVPCARWRQIDDPLLITNMEQLESAALVHKCTQFSQV